MKGGHSYGLRNMKFFLALLSVSCTTILLLGWEKTPSATNFLPPTERLNIPPLVNINSPRLDHVKNLISQPYKEELPSHLAKVEPRTRKGHMREAVDITPIGLSIMNLSGNWEDDELQTVHNKECNYAKGKWTQDNRQPSYSGFECKEWLSDMWACRLTQRTDFSYEGFKWQPENCEMPEFDGSTFLERMKDRTIALVGDSLGRQQFQSLMCMVTGGKDNPDVEDIGKEYGLIRADGALRPDGWAYRFPSTNTTILYHWSATLCELEPLNISNPAASTAMHLDRPARFLSQYLHKFDVLVLNTGHHWNRGKVNGNKWVMYVGGKPLKDRKLAIIGNAKNLTVHSVVKWLDSQLPQHPHLQVFLRTISPRHFMNGEWNTGGSCDNTIPLASGSQVLQENSSDEVADSAVKGTRVKLLDITALSQLRDEGHIGRYSIKASVGVQDCLHWCLPGIPDTWNEILAAQL